MPAGFARSIGLLALAGLIGGCSSSASPSSGSFKPSGRSGDSTAPPAAATPTETPPTTMTEQQVKQTALSRYREYQRVYKHVYETNNPAELSTVVMDPLLTTITKDVEATARNGEIWRFTNVLNPKVQAASKDHSVVVLLDCVRTLGAYRYSATSGKRLQAYRGGTFFYQVVMKYAGGTWKAAESKQGKQC